MTKVTRFTNGNDGGAEKRRLHLREISGDTDAPLGTVGQDLRAARLRLGEELASVSRVLKIRKDHLEALEEDRLEALPGRTYAMGFVRSYSTYLGLDAAEYLDRFKEEIAGRAESALLTPYIDHGERKLPQGWPIIAVVLVGLILYGLFLLIWPSSDADYPLVEPVPSEIAAAGDPVVAPTPPPPAPVAPLPTTAIPPAPDAAAPTEAANPATAAAELPKGQVFGARNADSRVTLRARQPVFVSIKGVDGTNYLGRMLQPGDTYRVPNRPVRLTTPHAEHLEVQLGTAAAKPLGPEGAVEGLPLDVQSLGGRASQAAD